jgi:hypothetical protein
LYSNDHPDPAGTSPAVANIGAINPSGGAAARPAGARPAPSARPVDLT